MSHPVLRLLAWIGRVGLLCLAVAAPLLALMLVPLMLADQQAVEGTAARVWLLVFVLVLVLTILVSAWVLLKRWFQAPFGPHGLFGSTALARLLGLGLASLLFPRVASTVVLAPVYALGQLWNTLPERSTAFVTRVIRSDAKSYAVDEMSYRMLEVLQLFGYEIARVINVLAAQLPMPDALLWLACWALLGQLFSPSAQALDANGAPMKTMRLVAALQRLSAAQQHALGLGLVFLVGAFFSAASIVAIPWLQDERVPANLSSENLAKALQASMSKAEDVQRLLGPDTATRAAPLQAVLDQLAAAKPGQEPAPPGRPAAALMYGNEQVQQAVQSAQLERSRALQRAQSLGKSLLAQQGKVQSSALRAFEVELGLPMSSQERLNFFKDIQRAFSGVVGSHTRQLSDCARTLGDLDARSERGKQALLDLLGMAPEARGDRIWEQMSELSRLASSYSLACVETPAATTEFLTPEPGAGWGPFGLIATWLLRTRSMALTLITGMLGFGLLGAAISTVVRSDLKRAEQPPIEEVGRIVVRGLSAALVVFLAVKGGLAVFTAGEASPNAYVLFFTCLVGAVFSEDVWQWARERLRKTTQAGGGGDAAGTKGGRVKAGAGKPDTDGSSQ
ncbi:hypothetical protein [Roseateles sp.]|jgi:hypothetical protein|uniref:hypothetical protein n=1 Tax=Roseateles sp. TaxID=1971397 RepID=UPI0037C52107